MEYCSCLGSMLVKNDRLVSPCHLDAVDVLPVSAGVFVFALDVPPVFTNGTSFG